MSVSPPLGKKQSAKPGTRPVGFRAQATRKLPGITGPHETTVPTPVASDSDFQATPAGTNARHAPPLKKRAKGSGFVALLFLAGFGAMGYFLWTSLLQYEAYGIIEGRLISVAAPWEGTVANWQVRDGDEVKQGQILAQISNLEMEHELAAYGDELKMSQAFLEAEISKVRFSVQNQSGRNQQAVAEYLQSSGELLAERAKLKELDGKFERTNRLADSNAVSRSEYEQVYFQLSGQKKKIEKLEAAVEVLRIRSTESNLNQNDGSPQLKPILAQIELTQSKIARLRERIDQGKIKAPVSGRVSKRFCLTGESAKAGETVIEILEDNSIEAVLYLPQRTVDEFEVGREMDVTLEPHRRPLRCTIARLGGRFETAPESIKGYYYENQPLLPVYLKPGPEASPLMEIRVGGTIKRPYEYRKALAKMVQEIKMAWASWCSPSIQTAAADSNREPFPFSGNQGQSPSDQVPALPFDSDGTSPVDQSREPETVRPTVTSF